MREHPEPVPNYTNAFLVTSGVTLFMAFFTIAAMAGFLWVALSAALIDGVIRLRAARLAAR